MPSDVVFADLVIFLGQLRLRNSRHATFTPLYVSVDRMLGSEAQFFVKRLFDFFTASMKRSYNILKGWIRSHLSFANLETELFCVHGSSAKWGSKGIVDGISLQITVAN